MSDVRCMRVSLEKLIVDPAYQRPVEEKRVARIVDAFDPKQVGTLELSKRKNGSYAVVDGQHRLAALKALGRKQAYATVHEGLGRKEEADLFARLNMGRKQLKPYERFAAQVFAGDERAVAISNAVTASGFKIARSDASFADRPTDIRAIRALEVAFGDLGEASFAEMMLALRDCWFGQAGTTDAQILRGFAIFWKSYGERFTEDHAERLKRADPIIIMQNARAKAINMGVGQGGGRSAILWIIADFIRKASGIQGSTGRKASGRSDAVKAKA